MKRSYLLVMALMLVCTAIGFVSCNDDNEGGTGNIDLPTPPYESVSGFIRSSVG